jgi:hypothetical protein
MGEHTTSTERDRPAAGTRRNGGLSDGRATPDLRLAVVRYDTESDKGTVYPPNVDDIAKMSTWISADLSAFVDVGENR